LPRDFINSKTKIKIKSGCFHVWENSFCFLGEEYRQKSQKDQKAFPTFTGIFSKESLEKEG